MTKRFTKKNQYVSSFLNKPFSKHNLETLKILNILRSAKTKNKYCLICIKPFQLWQLAKMTGTRGNTPKLINKFFNNLEDAERYVFKLRTNT